MSTTGGWFQGPEPTDARGRLFVESLRVAAEDWGFADLAPADTSTAAADIGRLVEVLVPGLTTSRRILRVSYDVSSAGGPSLRSEWTPFTYAFEGPDIEAPDSETELWVTGVDTDPEQCALWTAAWFERQLRRPVKRREWDRPTAGRSTLIPGSTTAPALVEWTAYEPEQYLDDHGALRWWWLHHRPPSREAWERPRS